MEQIQWVVLRKIDCENKNETNVCSTLAFLGCKAIFPGGKLEKG